MSRWTTIGPETASFQGSNTTVTIARVHRRLRKWGAPRRAAVQRQCSTRRKPSRRGGLFPTKAMSRPIGRSRPSIDPDAAAAKREKKGRCALSGSAGKGIGVRALPDVGDLRCRQMGRRLVARAGEPNRRRKWETMCLRRSLRSTPRPKRFGPLSLILNGSSEPVTR